MCKAFSCITAKSGKVYWKAGKDSHEDIKQLYNIIDIKQNPDFCQIEITPKDGNYLYPDQEWVLRFDNTSQKTPEWWKASHEKASFEALAKWKKEVYSLINLEEARKPIHPFKLPKRKPTKADIRLLKKWDSVWGSVGVSVWDSVGDSVWGSVGVSVGDSVRGSVGDSVWGSVGDLVRDSVWDSVWGYISGIFKIKFKFDFSCCVKLWKRGLVPSYDGKTWRLHSGKKAEIVFEISKEDLQRCE